MPLNVSVPPDTTKAPVPEIAPDSVPVAAVTVRVLPPRATEPAPLIEVTDAPEVVLEILNAPASVIPEEPARDPLPLNARVLPLPIEVAPVKVPPLAPVSVVVPAPVKFNAVEPVTAPDKVNPPVLVLLNVPPPVPRVIASPSVKPVLPVVANVPPASVSPPAPVPSGAALETATVLPLPIDVAPVKVLPLAPVSVVVPVPEKLSAVDPEIAPERVKPPVSELLNVPPPVPSVMAFAKLMAVLPVVAKVPLARESVPVDIFAADAIDSVPVPFTVVAKVAALLVPLSVSVPPDTIKPPVPLMAPDRVPEAAVTVRVLAPRVNAPLPDRAVTEVPVAVMPEMLNVPLSVTLEPVIAPLPVSNIAPPLLIVVAPV